MRRAEQTLSLYRAIPRTMSYARLRDPLSLDFAEQLGKLSAGFKHQVDTEYGEFDEYRLMEVRQTPLHVEMLVGRRSERIEDTSYMGDDGRVVTMEEEMDEERRREANMYPFITAHVVISKVPNAHHYYPVVVERVRNLSRSLIVQYLNHLFYEERFSNRGITSWIQFRCKSVPKRERIQRLSAAPEAEVRLQRSGCMDDAGALSWDLTQRARATGNAIARWTQGRPSLGDWESMTLTFNAGDARVQTKFDPRKHDLLEALWTEQAIVELDPPVTEHWREIDDRVTARALQFIR